MAVLLTKPTALATRQQPHTVTVAGAILYPTCTHIDIKAFITHKQNFMQPAALHVQPLAAIHKMHPAMLA
jgi:hypothetical protein